jgi:hypothetical protein
VRPLFPTFAPSARPRVPGEARQGHSGGLNARHLQRSSTTTARNAERARSAAEERRRCGNCEVEEEPVCSLFGYHGQQVTVDGSDGDDATLYFSPAPAELVCSLLLRDTALVEWCRCFRPENLPRGTRGSRLCGEDRDRLTENSKVCARTRDTRFIQVRAAKVASPTFCLRDQVWRPALGVGLSPEGLGMCG